MSPWDYLKPYEHHLRQPDHNQKPPVEKHPYTRNPYATRRPGRPAKLDYDLAGQYIMNQDLANENKNTDLDNERGDNTYQYWFTSPATFRNPSDEIDRTVYLASRLGFKIITPEDTSILPVYPRDRAYDVLLTNGPLTLTQLSKILSDRSRNATHLLLRRLRAQGRVRRAALNTWAAIPPPPPDLPPPLFTLSLSGTVSIFNALIQTRALMDELVDLMVDHGAHFETHQVDADDTPPPPPNRHKGNLRNEIHADRLRFATILACARYERRRLTIDDLVREAYLPLVPPDVTADPVLSLRAGLPPATDADVQDVKRRRGYMLWHTLTTLGIAKRVGRYCYLADDPMTDYPPQFSRTA